MRQAQRDARRRAPATAARASSGQRGARPAQARGR